MKYRRMQWAGYVARTGKRRKGTFKVYLWVNLTEEAIWKIKA
jgi:hypothetical protein